MKDPFAWRLLRWLYGAYFIFEGIWSGLQIVGVMPEANWSMSTASAAFMTAMDNTGYFFPLLALTFLISGLALFFYRTAPLGVALLVPVMVNIVLVDTFLDTLWFWAAAHAVPLIALGWHFRAAFRPLWSYGRAANEPTS